MNKGIACCYKVLLGGEQVINGRMLNRESYIDENHFMHFEGMGEKDKGIYYDDFYIAPENITITNGGGMYIFRQKIGNQLLKGWCELVGKTGYGYIEFGLNHGYALQLHPWAVAFEVQVSAKAGAYYSSAEHRLVWDDTSPEWNNPQNWVSRQMSFSYDVYKKTDPIGGEVPILECRFTDIAVADTPYWELTENTGYTATMSMTDMLTIDTTTAIPPLDPARANMVIKSIFPKKASFQFYEAGFSFKGAYLDHANTVYAVKGRGIEPISGAYNLEGIKAPIAVFGGKLVVNGEIFPDSYQSGQRIYWSKLDKKQIGLPVAGFLEFAENNHQITGGFTTGKRCEGRLNRPRITPAALASDAAEGLDILGLLGMNPMEQQDGKWYDTLGQAAMEDLYQILIYHMEPTLRNNFISNSPPELSPEVKQIAEDDHSGNMAFYRNLQTPYLVKALSNSTLDQAKYLNGNRAAKQLRQQFANNEVYKRHADKLYRMYWIKKFPNTVAYLTDQAATDYTAKIDVGFSYLKDNITQRMEALVDADSEQKQRLNELLKELDQLKQWTHDKKLYWAFRLYYHLTQYWLPVLEAKLKDGALAQEVTIQIKNYSSLFSMLENEAENHPQGKTFNQAFLDTVLAFQLTTIIPQYVDYTADDGYFLEVLDSIFTEFMKKYVNTTDPDLQDYVQQIRELLADRALTKRFVAELTASIRTLGAITSWDKIVTTFEGRCSQVFSKVSNWLVKCRVIVGGMAVGGFILVLTTGNFNALTPAEKTAFIAASASLFTTILVGVSRGFLRMYSLWQDFNGVWGGIKIFFGYEKFLATLPTASSKLSSGFAKWFVRSRNEMLPQSGGNFSKVAKIFGRNINQFLAETIGAALAIVTIIVSAIEIFHSHDPLEIAMNSLFIASGALQLIATLASWTLTIIGVTSNVITTIVSCLGPLAIAAALGGLILMIILMSKHQEPPDPLKDFVNSQAAQAGLKMSLGMSIDYFDIIPDKEGKSYDGIAMKNGNRYLTMQLAGAEVTSGDLVHNPNTVFFINTDANGLSRIFTSIPDNVNYPTQGNITTAYLSVNDQGAILALPAPDAPTKEANGTYDPAKQAAYQKKLHQQNWSCECTGNVSIFDANNTTYLMFANFTIKNQESQKYLTMEGKSIVLSDNPQNWTLSMEQIGPGDLSYHPNPLKIYTDSRDHKMIPTFNVNGSTPLTWTITPQLNAAFELSSSGNSQGVIQQRMGTEPPQMNTTYTVRVSNQINGHEYSSNCEITIQVDAVQAANPQIVRQLELVGV